MERMLNVIHWKRRRSAEDWRVSNWPTYSSNSGCHTSPDQGLYKTLIKFLQKQSGFIRELVSLALSHTLQPLAEKISLVVFLFCKRSNQSLNVLSVYSTYLSPLQTGNTTQRSWLISGMLFCLPRFCMVYSEVPNFSEPNPDLQSQTNQQNKSVSRFAPTTYLTSPQYFQPIIHRKQLFPLRPLPLLDVSPHIILIAFWWPVLTLFMVWSVLSFVLCAVGPQWLEGVIN